MRRTKRQIIITRPSLLEVVRSSSPLAQSAHLRGNAAGVHGGRKPKYSKRERQAARREQAQALIEIE